MSLVKTCYIELREHPQHLLIFLLQGVREANKSISCHWPPAVRMVGKLESRYADSSYIIDIAGVVYLNSTFPFSVDLALRSDTHHLRTPLGQILISSLDL